MSLNGLDEKEKLLLSAYHLLKAEENKVTANDHWHQTFKKWQKEAKIKQLKKKIHG